MSSTNGQAGPHQQDAAVIGVVVAGVLAAFVVPGPYDWGSMLIGVLLLLVLVAYADLSPSKGAAGLRHAAGTAAAFGFAALFAFGHFIDTEFPLRDTGLDEHGHRTGERWLSEWPVWTRPADEVAPDPFAGKRVLMVWFVLSVVAFVVLCIRRGRNGSGAAPGSTSFAPSDSEPPE